MDKWGAYRDGDFAEDWEIWLRWLHHGAVMEKLPHRMLVWNDAQPAATRQTSRYARAAAGWAAGTVAGAPTGNTTPFIPMFG